MKKSIILLHGALGSSDQLLELAELLKEYLQVWTYDIMGHGKSKKEVTHFSMSEFANELNAFIKTNEIIIPNVFG